MVLPEMWNCPYSNDSFPAYAEDLGGAAGAGRSPSADMLAAAAAAHRIVLVCVGGGGQGRAGEWSGVEGRTRLIAGL